MNEWTLCEICWMIPFNFVHRTLISFSNLHCKFIGVERLRITWESNPSFDYLLLFIYSFLLLSFLHSLLLPPQGVVPSSGNGLIFHLCFDLSSSFRNSFYSFSSFVHLLQGSLACLHRYFIHHISVLLCPFQSWKCSRNLPGGVDGPYNILMESNCSSLQGIDQLSSDYAPIQDVSVEISQCCANFNNCKGDSCVDDHEKCNAVSLSGYKQIFDLWSFRNRSLVVRVNAQK